MKKHYETPEWELTKLCFPNLLSMPLSDPEHGNSSGTDNGDDDIWADD